MKFACKLIHGGPVHLCHGRQYQTDPRAIGSAVRPLKGLSVGALKQKKIK